MKINCDKVLTTDDFDETYSSWQGRSLTVMGEKIKVSQDNLQPLYVDTVYLFDKTGILVGFDYKEPIPDCFITTKNGLISENLADATPYCFEDEERFFIVVKKQYKNTDLRKMVVGLNILEIPNLEPLYDKFTWPMWEEIISVEKGAILIKRNEASYAISTVNSFPKTHVYNRAFHIEHVEDFIYKIKENFNSYPEDINLEKKIIQYSQSK